MSYDTDLAKELKARNNVKRIGNLSGIVLSVAPLKIGISNNKVMLDDSNCFICCGLLENYTRKANIKNIENNITNNTEITFKDILKVNDQVLVISDVDGQRFFIVDKVVRVI